MNFQFLSVISTLKPCNLNYRYKIFQKIVEILRIKVRSLTVCSPLLQELMTLFTSWSVLLGGNVYKLVRISHSKHDFFYSFRSRRAAMWTTPLRVAYEPRSCGLHYLQIRLYMPLKPPVGISSLQFIKY